MNATLDPKFAAMMAGAKPATTRKKGDTPKLHAPELAYLTTADAAQIEAKSKMYEHLADVRCVSLLADIIKDLEARKVAGCAELIAAAEPIRVQASIADGKLVNSVRINGPEGVLYVQSPPNHQVVLKGEIVAAAMNADPEFTEHFTPIVKVKLSYKEIDAINRALDAIGSPCKRIEYELEWKPTQTLHEARTFDTSVAALCDAVLPDLKPTRYIRK